MKKVLITGAAGFIGSHLTEALLEEGFEVSALVRYNSRGDLGNLDLLSSDIMASVRILKGDLKDPDFCRRAVEGANYIFHLGALIAIPYSYMNPMDFVQTNIAGTTNLLNALKDSKSLERFVHTSTSEVYGTARYTPIDEQHPLQAQSPYSASKIGADHLVQSYHNSFELPITIIRPFNTYGPRQSARAVIPTIISQLYTSEEVKLGSLSPRRDFMFVKDTADGFIKVGLHSKTLGETINLGTGKGVSIGELFERISALMGKDVPISEDGSRIRPEGSEVMNLLADATKASKLSDWKPAYDLDKGLKLTIDWIGEYLTRFKATDYNI